jgi:Ca2+-binding EF-hand superfamily protein
MMDDNLDGKLSKDELRGKLGERLKAAFAFIDTNHDGFIEPDELRAVNARFGIRRGSAATPGGVEGSTK